MIALDKVKVKVVPSGTQVCDSENCVKDFKITDDHALRRGQVLYITKPALSLLRRVVQKDAA